MSAAWDGGSGGSRGGKAPRPIAEVLDALLKSRGLDADVSRAEVVSSWSGLVGPQIAAVTQPRMMTADGTLVVGVKTHGWMQELSLMERSLLTKINATNPHTAVQRIRWELLR